MSEKDFNNPDDSQSDSDLKEEEKQKTPLIETLMNSPEFVKNLFDSNPEIKRLREENPELNHILKDPQILKDGLEAIRNPNLMREIMRNTDRAMSNIEMMPGGFNALKRMYENIQEPLYNSVDNMLHTSNSNNEFLVIDTQKPITTETIPNPWSTVKKTTPLPPPCLIQPIPVEEYTQQTQQILSMGFNNIEKVKEALNRTHGNVNAALDLLLTEE